MSRTLVQRLSHEEEDVDKDYNLDDELDGDGMVLGEIGEESESEEEFDDDDDDDDDDADDDVHRDDDSDGYGEDEGDGDDDGGADAGDVEVDIGDVLHVTKSGRTCRTWKGKSLFYGHWLFWNLPLKLGTFWLSSDALY